MIERRGVGRLAVLVLAAAMLAAPFLALLYSRVAGLAVMGMALGATVLLLREAIGAAPPRVRRWLRLVMAFNIALAAVCLAVAIWLATRP